MYFILIIPVFFFLSSLPAESTHSTQELHESSSLADPFDIQVERSGTGYNVSWTIVDKKLNTTEHRIKRYVVKWYDAIDGKELGSVSTAANKRYIGEIGHHIFF